MNTLAYALFGAGVLAATAIGAAQPASADPYYEPNAPSPDAYRVYCEDPWYRDRYLDYCERYYNYDYSRYYAPPYQVYYDGYRAYPSYYFPYYYPGLVFGYPHYYGRGYYGHGYGHGGYGYRGYGYRQHWRGYHRY